ncbi:hypothetical protein ACOMHN_024823 [Nucella lapillus]
MSVNPEDSIPMESWAKIKGFSAWPGEIGEPRDSVKRPSKKTPHHFVIFFGSGDYAWVAEEGITPYIKLRDKYREAPRLTKPFREALESIESAWQALPESVRNTSVRSADEEAIPKTQNGSAKGEGKQGRLSAKKQLVASSQKKKTDLKQARKGIPKKRVNPLQSGAGDFSPSKKSKLASSSGTRPGAGILGRASNEAAGYVDDALEARLPLDDSQVPTEDDEAFPGSDEGKASGGVYGNLQSQAVIPTPLRIGFLGLGIMGQGMVMNLLRSGHEVTVWNRTIEKAQAQTQDTAQRMPQLPPPWMLEHLS